jgi:hypothetical protein
MTKYPEWDIPSIKDDVGITDNASDEWLTRRLNGLWDNIRKYTARYLSPQATFVDDWSMMSERHANVYPPQRTYTMASNSMYLSEYPVVSITECIVNGTDVASEVNFDPNNGQMVNATPESFLGAKIKYVAGYEKVPTDLYEVIVAIITRMYALRVQNLAGGGGAELVNVQDVGVVKFGAQSFGGFDSSVEGVTDPILGPYANVLDGYKDWRNKLGLNGLPRKYLIEAVAP